MNEFKIKSGLLLGSNPTQAVIGVTNSSTFFNTDASSHLATVKAITDFVNAKTVRNPDPSLNELYRWQISQDGSIIKLDGSLNSIYSDVVDGFSIFCTSTYADSTFIRSSSTGIGLYWVNGLLDVSIQAGGSDASINDLYQKNLNLNASLNELYSKDTQVDASLNDALDVLELFYLKTEVNTKFVPNASLGFGLYWVNGRLDVSVQGGQGGGVSQEYVDGSLNNIRAIYIPDSSLGNSFYWQDGFLEASGTGGGGGVSQEYVDGSLSYFVKSASLGNGLYFENTSKRYDVSLGLDSLTDVVINLPADNHILVYDGGTSKWINQPVIDISTIAEDASMYFQSTLTKNSPASISAGSPGQWCYDSSYLYICTSTNRWMRILGQSNY